MKMKTLDVSLHAGEPLRAGLLRAADGLIQNALDHIRILGERPGGGYARSSRDDKTVARNATLDPAGNQQDGFRQGKRATEKGSMPSLLGARFGCQTNT